METRMELYPKEYIASAAIKIDDELYVGKTHEQCITRIKSVTNIGIARFGFLTNRDEFVTRTVASEMAYTAKQTSELIPYITSDDLQSINGWFWNRELGRWDLKACGLCKHHEFTMPFCTPNDENRECLNLSVLGCDEYEPYYTNLHNYRTDMKKVKSTKDNRESVL